LKTATNYNHMALVIKWVQAARLKFLPQGVMPVILAVAIAGSQGSFEPVYFVIALTAAAAVQIGLTMFNDTLDYVYGTDKKTTGDKNPYSGGSGVLTSGVIKPKQALRGIIGLYSFALICAIYLSWQVGWELMFFAVIGAVISIIYSAKPFRFAYHGFGELMMFMGYGPIITIWGYYIHTASLTADMYLIGAIPGLLMWTMIIINEIPDYEEDRSAGKKNIVYRLGPARTKNLYISSLAAIFIYITLLIVFGILPAWCALAYLGLPLAAVSAVKAARFYKDPVKLAVANKYMVLLYSTTMITVTIGYLI
jgi:1,4-dihydroxy-2-naphthoate octaprenyltransferase